MSDDLKPAYFFTFLLICLLAIPFSYNHIFMKEECVSYIEVPIIKPDGTKAENNKFVCRETIWVNK